MTNSTHQKLEEDEHAELLALYQDAGRITDNYKKATFTYLIYYSAIAYALVSLLKDSKCLSDDNQIFTISLVLLGFGAIFCTILIWKNNDLLRYRREVLQRVFKNFTPLFIWCRAPEDLELKKVVDRGKAGGLIYYAALAYPFIVIEWLIIFLKPDWVIALFNYKKNEIISISSIIITCIALVIDFAWAWALDILITAFAGMTKRA